VGHWWFTPVILAAQEAEIRRIMVQNQPGQIDPILKKTHHKERAGGVAQGIGSGFKPQYHTHTHTKGNILSSHFSV
jgi:hypothetical protein